MARGLCSLEARRVGANHTPPDREEGYHRRVHVAIRFRPKGRSSQQRFVRLHARAILSSVGSQRQGVLAPCSYSGTLLRPLRGSTRLRSYRGALLVLSRRSPRPQRGRARGHRCVGVSRLCARLCPHRYRNVANHFRGVPTRLCPVSRCVFGESQWGWSDWRANPLPGPTARGLELEAELVAVSDR